VRLLENENSPLAILQSGNLSKSLDPSSSEWVAGSGAQEVAGMVGCVLFKHHQSFLLVTVSSCLSASLSQFEGDEERHWDYSCHTAHSSRVQSSVLINCEWGQTDTHYLSIEKAFWLEKEPPLQHSLLPQWALYWSGQGWGTNFQS